MVGRKKIIIAWDISYKKIWEWIKFFDLNKIGFQDCLKWWWLKLCEFLKYKFGVNWHLNWLYIHSIQLYKLFNRTEPNEDWIDLNWQQNFNDSCEKFMIIDSSILKVEENILPNRLGVLNNKIELQWLNQHLEAFKIHCKDLLLT